MNFVNNILSHDEASRWYNADDGLELNDGTIITFYHQQDCCESVYADLNALNDTGFFEDESLSRDNLKIEFVKGYGVRINGYGIPCYNEQNGYYSSQIQLTVHFDAGVYGKEEII